VVPPDFTRRHSYAGPLTVMAYQYFGSALVDVMPALGTHDAMTEEQLDVMYPGLPKSLIRVHRWRKDVVTLGEVPAEFVQSATEGLYDRSWPAQTNRLVARGGHDLVLSIGQVVPHEVIGMANYNKNIFIGTGGEDGINASHYISALLGIERILGTGDNALRRILNFAQAHFLSDLPLVFALTVVGTQESGVAVVRGLFIGDDSECFELACRLAREVNITSVEPAVERLVAYLDPHEFHSTWLGNKAIYRTRMAMADGGQLIILAPGVRTFGEDVQIDQLIRKYHYRNTPEVLKLVNEHKDLQANLGTAAHLMHSSPENRFRVTYCAGGLSRQEVENAGFEYGEVRAYLGRYSPAQLRDGWNESDGERFYFVRNPGLGLWAHPSRLC
jgi:nickel-dependent lactate racemase